MREYTCIHVREYVREFRVDFLTHRSVYCSGLLAEKSTHWLQGLTSNPTKTPGGRGEAPPAERKGDQERGGMKKGRGNEKPSPATEGWMDLVMMVFLFAMAPIREREVH